MKFLRILFHLNIITSVMTLPSSGGNFDLKTNWWEGTDIGVSGNYLTTKFKDAVIEPAFRTIVNTLNQMTNEIRVSNNNDELFLAANILMVLGTLFLWFMIHKKITTLQQRQDQNEAAQ